jgi:hypothetical protein
MTSNKKWLNSEKPLTRREEFVKAAMLGILSNSHEFRFEPKDVVRYADLILAILDKEENPNE